MKNRYEQLVSELSDKQILFSIFMTQIMLLVISSILGIYLFDHFSSFTKLFNWQDVRILVIGGGCGLVVVVLDLVLTKLLPKHFYDDGGVNERIFQNRNILQIALLAVGVAFAEEILFRGVLQTHFGLAWSSSLFALIHYRYLFNWYLFLNITALSFFIGYLYDFTGNLSVTIFMHFLIDFLLGVSIRIKHKKINRTG